MASCVALFRIGPKKIHISFVKKAGKGTLSKPNILKPHQAKKSFGRDLFSFETIYAHLKSDALTAQWCAVKE